MVKGKYTDNENRKIMKIIVKQNENAIKHHYTLTDPIWTEIGIQLNRCPRNIYDHWEEDIKPRILQFENKIENEDIRHVLIDYFVEKGIKIRSEIDWREIIKDERFKGTTQRVLSKKLAHMVFCVKKANPDLEGDDITIEDLRQHSDERGRKPRINKSVRGLIEIYENIKNGM